MKISWHQILILIGILFCSVFVYWCYQQYLLQQQLEQKKIEDQESYQLISKHCWFKVDWQKTVKCFHLKTPLSSGEYYLPVVIIKDESIDHRHDPVVYLQGGPGLGAALDQDGINKWINWLTVANLKRDLILMDPRGTGLSLPRFNCTDDGEQSRLWRQNIGLSDELKINNQSMMRCFNSLEKQFTALSPKYLGTQLSATDLINLIQQLNYKDWNILGVSYGTRLALEVDRQLSAKANTGLKSMVLDSVYPAGYGGVQTWPQVLDYAVSTFFTGCLNHEECKKVNNSNQLKEELLTALIRLKSNPIGLTISRWDGEAPMYFLVNDHRFLSAIFAAIYDSGDWPDIAKTIYAVNYQTGLQQEQQLKKFIEPYLNRNLNSQFNSLAFTAVDCADNAMGSEQDFVQSLIEFPLMADYTKDQWQHQLCHQLPLKSHLQIQAPQVPTLLLSGKNDPVTPSAWAVAVHRQWKNSQLILRENLAHSVLSTDICLLQNLYKFFDGPEIKFDVCVANAENQ